MKEQFFLALIDKPEGEVPEGSVITPALLFVEGEQTSCEGFTEVKTAEMLRGYAAASNAWISSGRKVAFFLSAHGDNVGYSVKDKIGHFDNFVAREIEEKDIKDPAFNDLVGKFGVFAVAHITDKTGVDKYNSGNLDEISVGIADLEEGYGEQIFEVSAVPIGAVRGAKLYGRVVRRGGKAAETPEAGGKERSKSQVFALTLEGAIAEQEAPYSLAQEFISDLTWMAGRVISNIQAAPAEELAGRDRQTLLSDVVEDLAMRLREHLGLSALPPIPTGDNFMKFQGRPLDQILSDLKKGGEGVTEAIASIATELSVTPQRFSKALTPTDTESTQLYSRIIGAISTRMSAPETPSGGEDSQRFAQMQSQLNQTALRAENAESQVQALQAVMQTSNRFMALRTRAAKLNAEGKLAAAAFREYFPEGETPVQAVQRFSAAPKDGETVTTLDEIEASLNHIERFGVAVATGSQAGGAGSGSGTAPAAQDAGTADMESFFAKNKITGEERQRYEKQFAAANSSAA